MPAVYDLINDYGSPDMVVSLAPVWVLTVVRWSHPFVFDRENLRTDSGIAPFDQAQEPVVITSDCTDLTVTSAKGSHIASLNATLRDNNTNYLSAFFPDDWLLAWIVPNETKARDLIARIKAGQQCNEFYDGLRFFGRVNTCFKDTLVSDDGKPQSIYNLTGVGFSEFDTSMFWEPLLATNDSLPVWYQRLGIAFNSIVTGKDKSVTQDSDPNVIDVNKMIPALVRLCLGEGPFTGGNIAAVPGGPNASPNGGIRIPRLVSSLLGMEGPEPWTYSDVVDIVVGVQKFAGAAGAPQNSPLIFQPDGLQTSTVTIQRPIGTTDVPAPSNMNFDEQSENGPTTAEYQSTKVPLLGGFPIVQLPFQDTPIWQVMEQFLNPAINEMYVSLKPDENGDVFPRLTVRQLPFCSNKFASTHAGGPVVTTYLELPRWRIDPKMLKRIQVGRSNVLRSNFWHIQATGPGAAISPTLQYVDHPPITDQADIERSGLRRVFQTVACALSRGPRGVEAWQNIITDITAGQQLSLTGIIQTAGIIAPIAPGDNVQFANVVYHVESVSHNCSMGSDGRRDWKTTLQVSHGMADETTLEDNILDTSLDAPLQEYAGVRQADQTTVDIGHTVLDDNLGVS